jgi:L-lactate dehydrogenase complex protein LldG
MESTTSRESILSKIRKGLIQSTSIPFAEAEHVHDLFFQSNEDNAVLFAEKFTSLQGKFIYTPHEIALQDQLRALIAKMGWVSIFCNEPILLNLLNNIEIEASKDLTHCDVSITSCEVLIANTGSIVISSAKGDRTSSVYAPIHVTIAFTSQLVHNIEEGLTLIQKTYGKNFPSFLTLASGPSRTADIEKTLVTGVHGPKEVYCFLMEDHA